MSSSDTARVSCLASFFPIGPQPLLKLYANHCRFAALYRALDEHLSYLDEQRRWQKPPRAKWARELPQCLQERQREQRGVLPAEGAQGNKIDDENSCDGTGSNADGSGGGGSGHAAAQLWSQRAVDALFFALLHDPSIKVSTLFS